MGTRWSWPLKTKGRIAAFMKKAEINQEKGDGQCSRLMNLKPLFPSACGATEEQLDKWATSYERLQSRLTRHRKAAYKKSSAAGEEGAGDVIRGTFMPDARFESLSVFFRPMSPNGLTLKLGRIGPFAFMAHNMLEPVTIPKEPTDAKELYPLI